MAKAERDVQRRLRCVSTDFLPKSDDSLCRGKLGSKRQGPLFDAGKAEGSHHSVGSKVSYSRFGTELTDFA